MVNCNIRLTSSFGNVDWTSSIWYTVFGYRCCV